MISSLIAMGTAFLVFYFTIQYEKNKEKKKLQETHRNRIFYLSSLVTSSIKNVEDITKNLDLLIERFENDDLAFPLLDINPDFSFDRIHEILKNENYFLAYMQYFGNTAIKEFNKISLDVDYFKMQVELLSDMHKSAQKYDFERKKQFKIYTDDILKICGQLTQEPDIEDDDRRKITLYIREYYSNQPKNKSESESITHCYYFIRNVLKDVIIMYSSSPTFKYEWYIFRDASSLYQDIKFQNESHKEDLKLIKKSLSDALIAYKKDTSRLLRETEFK